MSPEPHRYEARLGPDGGVEALIERDGSQRTIAAGSPEAITVLAAGAGVLYRFEDGWTLRDVPYPEVLEGLRREIQLAAHRARHGELVDEPEALPELAWLLAAVVARAAEFERSLACLERTESQEGA